ncbi:MAG: hypothetical protein HY689_08725 [Chloroflexi bacterium]|nr:hypothetical protein [Chloroflexota bacterium]
MTLAIAMVVSDGIVLAADSKLSLTTPQGTRDGSNASPKVFQLTPGVGVTTCGWADFAEGDPYVVRTVASLIEEFCHNVLDASAPPEAIAHALGRFFQHKYEQTIACNYRKEVSGSEYAIKFFLAGYDAHSTAQVWECEVPGPSVELGKDSTNPGPTWDGLPWIIQRLLLGYDGRIVHLPIFNAEDSPLSPEAKQELYKQLRLLNARAYYSSWLLQDAIDYVVWLIRTSIEWTRFFDGIGLKPGQAVILGEPVDVAVIQQHRGFFWLQRKPDLHIPALPSSYRDGALSVSLHDGNGGAP